MNNNDCPINQFVNISIQMCVILKELKTYRSATFEPLHAVLYQKKLIIICDLLIPQEQHIKSQPDTRKHSNPCQWNWTDQYNCSQIETGTNPACEFFSTSTSLSCYSSPLSSWQHAMHSHLLASCLELWCSNHDFGVMSDDFFSTLKIGP